MSATAPKTSQEVSAGRKGPARLVRGGGETKECVTQDFRTPELSAQAAPQGEALRGRSKPQGAGISSAKLSPPHDGGLRRLSRKTIWRPSVRLYGGSDVSSLGLDHWRRPPRSLRNLHRLRLRPGHDARPPSLEDWMATPTAKALRRLRSAAHLKRSEGSLDASLALGRRPSDRLGRAAPERESERKRCAGKERTVEAERRGLWRPKVAPLAITLRRR